MVGEAKQLEGNTDGKLLLFERLIYQAMQNFLNPYPANVDNKVSS